MRKFLILLIATTFVGVNSLPVFAGEPFYDSTKAKDLEYPDINIGVGVSPTSAEINNDTSSGASAYSNVNTDPRISQSGYQSNTQYNNAFGVDEWPMSTMKNVGALPNGFVGFSGGYNNSNWGTSQYNNNGYTNGYDFRIFGVIPTGTGLDEKILELGEIELENRRIQNLMASQEAALKEAELVELRIKNWTSTITMCVNLDKNNGKERIVIDPVSASPVMKNILAVCQGLDIVAMQAQLQELEQYRRKVEMIRDCQKNPSNCVKETPN